MATVEEMLQATDEILSDGARRGLMHNDAEDTPLNGRTLTIDGRELLNFGSCSYLGLERHPALITGVTEAARRYGTQFSSSRAYVSAPAYVAAEEALTDVFGRPALITTSTSLGHIAALSTLVGARDALILDHQVHQSVQAAARHPQIQGSTLTLIPHNDLRTLERRITELTRAHRRIWYCTDGLFSMFADYAPVSELNDMMERHPTLWLYVDDAHSVSWSGRHGRGHVLPRLSAAALPRTVVAGSLNKSFAAAGGVLAFPDTETRRRVFTVGGPMVFSGPVQPPMLGAILASARLHLTAEVTDRQAHLMGLIRHFNEATAREGLPLVSPSEAPIRCVAAGVPSIAYEVTGRLRDAGYFVNTAIFPGVPAKLCGTRIALTANHTVEDVTGLVEALAEALPAALATAGSSATEVARTFAKQLGGRPVRLRPVAPAAADTLTLATYNSIDAVDQAEWDQLFAGRGAFASTGLRALERTFTDSPEPEHTWRFHYRVVRDRAGIPVAATFFTTALWKEDMLSPPQVSAEVELARAADPYYLTSTMIAMGSLLTEGDHLYLDRRADWRGALRLILRDIRAEEDRIGADALVLRDLPHDDELNKVLIAEGFLRIPIYPTWERAMDFTDDAQFLAGLTKKHRYHQRTNVLAWEERFDIRVYAGGQPGTPSPDELDELYNLYRNVHARKLELNVFPLPRRLLDSVMAHNGWELVTLQLPEIGQRPVAFALQHCGPGHVQPIFVGLDYRYVASHHTYQQILWQAIRSAQRHHAPRVLFGMNADLHKARFGAAARERWVYVQPTETYHSAVLTHIAEQSSPATRAATQR